MGAHLNRKAEIARLNDLARREPQKAGAAIVMTPGVQDLLCGEAEQPAPARVGALLRALASFDTFDGDNDPHGERDFGILDVFGERVMWKIDYFHPEREEHSPAPWSVELTRRVLTLMLPLEY